MNYFFAMVLAFLPAPSQFDQLSDFQKLVEIRKDYEAVQTMQDRNLLKDEVADGHKTELLKLATTIDAEIDSYDDLKLETEGFMQKVGGFFTFRNILLVTAACVFTVAVLWLCGIYLLAILMAIPLEVYELLCYGACAWAIFAGTQVSEAYKLAFVLPGCLGLMGCLAFTHSKHLPQVEPSGTVYSALLCFIWGAVAAFYGSEVIGFMSVAALLSSLGFMAGIFPGVIFVGFEDEDVVLQGTIASFGVLAVHIILTAMNVTVEWLEPFRPGMEFLGTFGYFLGLIIMASKYYWGRDDYGAYFLTQIAAIISGVAALYLGSVLGMGMLLGVGGTWFYIFVLEKYYEIPWKDSGWAWSLLGLSGILYGMYVFAVKYPEYFLW